ncbi:MAG: hypothetical protein AAF978_06525, partial [Cyanobacteria bacterium P01_E01_bin.48]
PTTDQSTRSLPPRAARLVTKVAAVASRGIAIALSIIPRQAVGTTAFDSGRAENACGNVDIARDKCCI